MTFLYLFFGIAGLLLASEIVISGALDIAERFKISGASSLCRVEIGRDGNDTALICR